ELRAAEQAFGQLLGLLVGQRFEGKLGPGPSRACVEELLPREAEDNHRAADLRSDALDEVQKRRLGPMQVVEQEHDRLALGEQLEQPACSPEDLRVVPLA